MIESVPTPTDWMRHRQRQQRILSIDVEDELGEMRVIMKNTHVNTETGTAAMLFTRYSSIKRNRIVILIGVTAVIFLVSNVLPSSLFSIDVLTHEVCVFTPFFSSLRRHYVAIFFSSIQSFWYWPWIQKTSG